MELFDGFRIVEPYPALYIEHLDTVVVADLHLGLESLMAKGGQLMPKFQLDEMQNDLEAIVDAVQPSRLVICGDMKHEFSETSYGEREEVQAFLDHAVDLVDEVRLIKGNHDNYLIYPVKEYDSVTLDEGLVLDGVCFVHGHESLDDTACGDADTVVMGHEHPALALKDDVGVTEKLPCFLYGHLDDGPRLIVLPAFSRLAEGSRVNQVPESELLSPVLRDAVDIGTLQAVGVDRDAGLFEFPALEKLRGASGR